MEISVFTVSFFALSSVDGLNNDNDLVESTETNKIDMTHFSRACRKVGQHVLGAFFII